MMKRFRGLTEAQARVFEQIAVGNDRGHSRKTLTKLLSLGLITSNVVQLPPTPSCKFPARVTRYDVPTNVHMEWCRWCSDHEGDPDES